MTKRNQKNDKKWSLTTRERRAVLFLLPLVAALVWILWTAGRPRIDQSATLVGNSLTLPAANTSYNEAITGTGSDKAVLVADDVAEASERVKAVLFRFDPNTATYEDFRALGIAGRTAAGIVKYRLNGKVFQIPEDFAACYGISDSMYAELKPYINIGAEFRLQPRQKVLVHDSSAVSESPAIEQSAREIPPVSSLKSAASGPRLVELNTADSLELLSVRGIGEKSVSAIMAYRELLGGFHSVEQLTEMNVIFEKNYELMQPYIWADSCEIRKIDVNFAPANAVNEHPYMKGKLARRILSKRQLKGGWSTIEDMIEDKTLTSNEAARLAPYLQFTTLSR